MKTAVIHYSRFGPYHLARINSARLAMSAVGWEVVGLETAGGDATYAWRQETGSTAWQRITVFPGEAAEAVYARRMKAGIHAALDQIQPHAVAVSGWGSSDARACLSWAKQNGAKAIVMSETREADGNRVWWKEFVKSRIIRRFDAAIVGGKSHRDYLVQLGLPAHRIGLGYNVVNNQYFTSEVERWQTHGSESEHQRPYFLTSNRFIERKNLPRLIDAYASYVQSASKTKPSASAWNLCLLGDGDQKPTLISRCAEHGLVVVQKAPWEQQPTNVAGPTPPTVFFPGFRQIEQLPRFYAGAGCFVHPALEEPWGLVINEAMASGLPILSGSNVGAAEELIDAGVNGWQFDAERVEAISEGLTKIAGLTDGQRREMGRKSGRILEERCPTEAFGQGLAGLLDKLLVSDSC